MKPVYLGKGFCILDFGSGDEEFELFREFIGGEKLEICSRSGRGKLGM